MYMFIGIIIFVVSLFAYAGVVTLHEKLSDVRYRATISPVARPETFTFNMTTKLDPSIEGNWDGRHPQDRRVRRSNAY